MIRFENVSRRYGQHLALRDFTLTVQPGEVLTVIGPSGGGKTTALKLVNGLLTPDSGDVWVQGRPVSGWDPIALRRSIGYVIQEVGLFPHWPVARSVAVSLVLAGWSQERIATRTRDLLQLVGLPPEKYLDRMPHELSGGQAQRVGVARALATNPKVLLMDEPFGALDPLTRHRLQAEFKSILANTGATVMLVTHDLREALRLGDRVAVVAGGRLEQVGTPGEIVSHPVSPFLKELLVAEGFTGSAD